MPHLRRIEARVAVTRVERAVAEEPERRAMDIVRSAACHGVDHSARCAAELRQVGCCNHLKFLYRVLRDLRADACATGSFLVVLIGRIVSVGEERIAERHATERDQPKRAVTGNSRIQ